MEIGKSCMEVPGRALDDKAQCNGHSSYQGRNSRITMQDV